MQEAIDISQAESHIVPTPIVAKDDNVYVGNLGLFPITLNASKILTLSKDLRPIDSVPGLDVCADVLKVIGSRAGFATIVALDLGRTDSFMRSNCHQPLVTRLQESAKWCRLTAQERWKTSRLDCRCRRA